MFVCLLACFLAWLLWMHQHCLGCTKTKLCCMVHCWSHLIEDSKYSETIFVTCCIVKSPIILLVHDNVQLQGKPDKQQGFDSFTTKYFTGTSACAFCFKDSTATGLTHRRKKFLLLVFFKAPISISWLISACL